MHRNVDNYAGGCDYVVVYENWVCVETRYMFGEFARVCCPLLQIGAGTMIVRHGREICAPNHGPERDQSEIPNTRGLLHYTYVCVLTD